MFYENTKFDFTSILESNWLVIKQELSQLQRSNFIPWKETFLYGKGWDVFGLYAFGTKLADNCRLCPETTRLAEMIPGMTTAGFSSLAPGTHILPHIGYSYSYSEDSGEPERVYSGEYEGVPSLNKAVLRCHLGLIVPDGCAIRVGFLTRNWQEGKCLIFDDTIVHEAWNRGNATRVLLLIDFKKPNT